MVQSLEVQNRFHYGEIKYWQGCAPCEGTLPLPMLVAAGFPWLVTMLLQS
jgi:hypothetical protein